MILAGKELIIVHDKEIMSLAYCHSLLQPKVDFIKEYSCPRKSPVPYLRMTTIFKKNKLVFLLFHV